MLLRPRDLRFNGVLYEVKTDGLRHRTSGPLDTHRMLPIRKIFVTGGRVYMFHKSMLFDVRT